MPEIIHNGACACGGVRFEARGAPYRVGVCHCLTCRRAHGAPFGLFAVFPTEAVTIEREVLLFESSEKGKRYACGSCGAPAYSGYGRPDEIYLYPGLFDETGLFQPSYELWTVRREPWLPEFPSVVRRYEKDRPQWKRTESA